MADDNGSNRMDRIERAIENLTARIENLAVNIESLHASVHELYGIAQAHGRDLQVDAENIRRLARIAEAHERRLDDLEGREEEQ